MKKLLTVCTALLSLGCLSPSFAWDFQGHVLVADVAYAQLTPVAKQRADQLANIIFNQLPPEEQQKLENKFPNVSHFAQIAMLPDVWRKWHVETIFNAFNAPVPASLEPYADESTQGWHFINLPYPSTAPCPPMSSENNVVWAITRLNNSLKETTNPNDEAVMMTLLEHYVGDVHQPLHVISNVSAGYSGDEGGNGYCLKAGKNGRCGKSLHSLWDSAVGWIKPKSNISQLAYQLESRYPKATFAQPLEDTNPLDWAKTNYGYAAFIYSTPKYQKPSPNYYHQGQILAQSQLALAGYRLGQLLNHDLGG